MAVALHRFRAYTVLVAMLFVTTAHAQSDCRPAPAGVAQLLEIRPGFHRVQGPLAEFDPCHRSVQLSMPGFFADKLSDKPPLMIIAHGGNGPGSAEQEMVRRMNARGVATLLFDAYEMNGFQYRGTSLFLTGTTNESRQRMIFKATLGAYHWIRQNPRVDTTRLFIHGLSNGGSVALNMAAVVDPAHVRVVYAEGAPSAGIGMPDQIRVPLKWCSAKWTTMAAGPKTTGCTCAPTRVWSISPPKAQLREQPSAAAFGSLPRLRGCRRTSGQNSSRRKASRLNFGFTMTRRMVCWRARWIAAGALTDPVPQPPSVMAGLARARKRPTSLLRISWHPSRVAIPRSDGRRRGRDSDSAPESADRRMFDRSSHVPAVTVVNGEGPEHGQRTA